MAHSLDSRNVVHESAIFTEETSPNICNMIYKNALRIARASVRHEEQLHKQNMLYYRIINFAESKETSPTAAVFPKKDYDIFKQELKTEFKMDACNANFSKTVMSDKCILKKVCKMKKSIKKMLSPIATSKLWVFKCSSCTSLMNNYENEEVYLYFTIAPIIKPLFKIKDMVELKFGETYLLARATEINNSVYDDERRVAGPKIDVILKDRKYNVEIALIEVTGLPNKVDNTHFLEDRNKICKNSKAMHKYIISKMEVPDVTLKKKLKLFGFQFYRNQVYVYSLFKPCDDFYTFSLDVTFPTPNSMAILDHALPTFIKNICILQEAIEITRENLEKIFCIPARFFDFLALA